MHFEQTLKDAIRCHGGAHARTYRGKTYVILAGPLCGSYHIQGSVIRYRPSFSLHILPRKAKERVLSFCAALSGLSLPLYVLAQIAGVPRVQLEEALNEEPRRARAIPHFPHSFTKRKRYAQAFFETWSSEKAQHAAYPHVPSVRSVPSRFLTKLTFQYLLVPSWKQKVLSKPLHEVFNLDELEADLVVYPGDKDLLEKKKGTPEARLREFLNLQHFIPRVRREGITPEEFQHLIFKGRFYDLRYLLDSLRICRWAKAAMAETVEGRRLLSAVEQHDWKAVLRAHDVLQHYVMVRSPAVVSKSNVFHARAAKYVCPPGVFPLCTEEDFRVEGRGMNHCVASYFWQRRSHCFSFQADDGTRATLETFRKKDGSLQVEQFKGPKNETASTRCRVLLKQFLVANKKETPWATKSGRAKKEDATSSASL